MGDRRTITLGWFEILAPAIGAVAVAGGSIGSALITADATKYAARTTSKTQLAQILSQERVALAVEKGTTERDVTRSSAESSQFKTVALGLAGLGVLWLTLRG